MTKTRSLYFFVGTTAELIKLAPVIRELKHRKKNFKIIASNQNILHFNQLKPIMGEESADYTFVMTKFARIRDIYLSFVFWVVRSLGNYWLYFRKEFKGLERGKVLFVVHGDTVTAVIGAMIAKLCRVKLIHIESGLRSFNFLEPFPEEINRFVISWFADVHFCPNNWAKSNLRFRKGVKVNTLNNTIGESIGLALKSKTNFRIQGLRGKKYFVLVVHRQEHTLFNRKNSKKVINLFANLASPDMKCVLIMHKLTEDYLVKQKMYLKLKKNRNVIMPDRLPFVEFIKLVKSSEFIATDGGSNQEEAYYLGKPCLILRNHTERVEGLGENAVLAGGELKRIKSFFAEYKSYNRDRVTIEKSPARIIVDSLVET